LALIFICMGAYSSSAKTVTIKLGTLAPEGSSWTRYIEDLNRDIIQQSGQQVRLRVYAGGVLGDEKDMLRKMHIGQIHGAALSTSSLSTLFEAFDTLQVPFLFETYDEIDHVIGKMDAFFRQGLAQKGYALLGWSEGGFVHLMSTMPVATLSDLKTAKVWTWQDSPMAQAIFEEAGLAAIPLTVPDVMVGLQTGLVDVVYAPPAGAISLQWFTRTKYLCDLPLIYMAGAIVIKQSILDKLPAEVQQIVFDRADHHLTLLKQKIRIDNREALKVMTQHGTTILTPPEADIREFREVSRKAMQRLVQKGVLSQPVLDTLRQHLSTYRGK
jgi:TRAP-type C4-dicarboxylate transport system substrate-binding protein